jgi:tetratricopeptide (TPR) repeat protein
VRIQPAIAIAALMLPVVSLPALAQMNPERERARIQYRIGWEDMRSEAWEKAAKSFQNAIDIDGSYELAYYMLGRANMALKRYPQAVAAYTKCRDLYEAQAGRQFSNAQEAQRARSNRLTELDDLIRQVQSAPPTAQTQEQMRQLQEQRQRIQDAVSNGYTLTLGSAVPPWVSLALGSAYFRLGRLGDAEKAYKATVDADGKAGEAHSNLAALYLETGRIEEAERSIKAAEKTGFKVNPGLKEEIKKRHAGRQ